MNMRKTSSRNVWFGIGLQPHSDNSSMNIFEIWVQSICLPSFHMYLVHFPAPELSQQFLAVFMRCGESEKVYIYIYILGSDHSGHHETTETK